MTDVLSSKTLTFWLMLLVIALALIVFATAAEHFGLHVPYVTDFFQLLGLGGGAGTARNVVTDGVMPRLHPDPAPPGAPPGPPPGPSTT